MDEKNLTDWIRHLIACDEELLLRALITVIFGLIQFIGDVLTFPLSSCFYTQG